MALCEGIFDLIDRQRASDGFQRVRRVIVEIGAFGHVEPDALRFAFKAIAPGTVADSAELDIIEIPARAWCMTCNATVDVVRRGDPCGGCGGYQLLVQQGEELRLKELEVV